jgi:hypothetical protein
MSVFCKPNRGFLLDVDRNPILHGILKKTFYEQFCAGENGKETKATINELKDMGFRGVIMTYAKETVFDHKTNTQQGLGVAALESEKNGQELDPSLVRCANIEAWRKGTMETVEQLEDGDYLAVKYDLSCSLRIRIRLTFHQTDWGWSYGHSSLFRGRTTPSTNARRIGRNVYPLQRTQGPNPRRRRVPAFPMGHPSHHSRPHAQIQP